MREVIPRPFLLALTLLLVIGAIALIELRLDAASPDDARAKRNNEPVMEERRDPTKDPSGAREERSMAGQPEKTGEMSERKGRKGERFERAEEIVNPTGFINTDGVSLKEARGEKIVLLDFWTYSCFNCQNTQPYLNRWHEKYADEGLRIRIIGVHTPEFAFEREYANVERAVREAGIEYPVVLDNSYATWNAYDQQYWPTMYLIDADGFIRYKHIGEGAYEETEAKIRQLLAEKDRT